MSISNDNEESQRSRPNPTKLRQCAKIYWARGWSIIPIKHQSESGKEPACRSWKEFQQALPTSDQIDRWFNRKVLDGLAVICGPVSDNLVCRDFDQADSYIAWAEQYLDLAANLPTVQTARGFHVYFRCKMEGIKKFADGELRAGGYCLLPPSLHPSGLEYSWVVPLPQGKLPEIDPEAAGLVGVTERTERQRAQSNRVTESNIKNGFQHSPIVANECKTQDKALDELIEQAIQNSLPTKPGERNRMVFELVQYLKAIPALADANPRDLREIVQKWHIRARPFIQTQPFEDTWGDFLYAWPNAKFAKGANPLKQVLHLAEAEPFPPEAALYENIETKRLVRYCRQFQRTVGDSPFFLACRSVARLFDMDYRTAARRLRAMCGDGLLEVVRPGTGTQAARYRYRERESTVGVWSDPDEKEDPT